MLKATTYLCQMRPVQQMTWLPTPPDKPPIIQDQLINQGGWVKHPGAAVFNLYLPPPPSQGGNPQDINPWLDHIGLLYPEDRDHIIRWLAHRVQKPGEKLNHALLLGGDPRIGKDTIIEPVKRAIGSWNCKEVSPQEIMGQYNGFLQTVILRVSETRDLGEHDRYAFYERMKTYIAAPPDVLRVSDKYIPAHEVPNIVGVIETTNHKEGGMYLPADDGRHYVAWSEKKREEFPETYFDDLWTWFDEGGAANVAAYLAQPERLAGFNPKAPPPRTPAFWDIVGAHVTPEEAELADVLETILDEDGKAAHDTAGMEPPPYSGPKIVTLNKIIGKARCDFTDASIGPWLQDRRNWGQIPHRMKSCGYVPVRNPEAKDGLWKIGSKRQTVYGRAELGREALISLVKKAKTDKKDF